MSVPRCGADAPVRAGPPGPAFLGLDDLHKQADVGVGRGPGAFKMFSRLRASGLYWPIWSRRCKSSSRREYGPGV
jgi:hypothetical protein